LDPDRKAGGFVVTFPDFSYGVTQGETLEEAIDMAQDLLSGLVSDRIDSGQPLPKAARRGGRNYRQVALPALQSAKAELYQAFRASGLRKSELADRLGINKSNLDRLFDLKHASRLDRIEAAFRALGKQLEIGARDAA
jgi:antitoxin HicB